MWQHGAMPRLLLRRTGPIGVALTAYDLWKRLPQNQRDAIVEQARRYGPRAASGAMVAARAAARRLKK